MTHVAGDLLPVGELERRLAIARVSEGLCPICNRRLQPARAHSGEDAGTCPTTPSLTYRLTTDEDGEVKYVVARAAEVT